MKNFHLFTISSLFFSLFINGCAPDQGETGGKGDKTAPQITLTSPMPTGVVSGTVTFGWSINEDNPASLEILLSSNAGAQQPSYEIIDTINNYATQGSYTFNSTNYADGTQYRLKLVARDVPNNQSSVTSDIFAIQNGVTSDQFSITLNPQTIPASKSVKDVVNISWQGLGLDGASLDIDMSEDGFNFSIPIAHGLQLTGNNGSYNWDTTSLNYPQAVIRLIASKNAVDTLPSYSNGFFSVDNTAPVLPQDTQLTFSSDSNAHVVMSWTEASDAIDQNLKYSLYYSSSNDITTLSQIQANGNLFNSINAKPSFDLGTDPVNLFSYWNLVVSDAAGNSKSYSSGRPQGVVNSSFGTNGVVTINDGIDNTRYVTPDAIVTDPQNKILVVGNTDALLTIWRFTENGEPDPSFGTLGKVTYPNPFKDTNTPVARAIAIDSGINSDPLNYRIIVCGDWYVPNGTSGSNDLMVQVFDAQGARDTTFNGPSGYYSYSHSGGQYSTICNGVAVDSNHNIYLAASGLSNAAQTSYDMVLLKFTRIGSLDANFGNAGVLTLDRITGVDDDEEATGITIDANDNIYLTGWNGNNGAYENMAIVKLDSNGSPVNFSALGSNVITSNLYSIGDSILLDSQNNIIVNGYELRYPTILADPVPVLTAWRYTPAGEVDASFASNGIFSLADDTLYFHPADAYITFLGLALDAKDNVYLTGNVGDATTHYINVWRLDKNGQPSTNWWTNGRYSDSEKNANVRAIYINPINQSLYLGGFTQVSPFNIRLIGLL